MKHLGNLRPAKGSNRPKKRLGRGMGSGLGKTAGRGHKGSGQRKSGNVRPGFEGGQMPLYMRLPKRGFKNPFRKEFNIVNLENLERFDSDATVDPRSLDAAGLLRHSHLPVKVLGRGELSKKLIIRVHKASTSAKTAIEKAGGTLQIIEESKEK